MLSFSFFFFSAIFCRVPMLPEKLCWVYSMDQIMKWGPHRRRNLLGPAWSKPQPYKQLPMRLQMPALHQFMKATQRRSTRKFISVQNSKGKKKYLH